MKEQELCMFLVKELVSNKDEVKIETVEEENAIVFKVSVAEADIGRVIGREGRTANAIRTLVRALSDSRKKIIVKFN